MPHSCSPNRRLDDPDQYSLVSTKELSMTRTSRLSTLLSRSQDGRLRANRKKLASRRMVLENLEGRCVLSSISGIVFNDANGNGSQDGGELPLAGITVFHETDGNSILDAGEDSAVT